MQKLYEKHELVYSLLWIVVYVVGTSAADRLSERIGIEKCVTLPFLLLLSGAAWMWLGKNSLFREYGLCKTEIKASRYLYYLPLAVLASCNLWRGVAMNLPLAETILYIGSMLCVGFLEELIFRGFLFKAMSRDGIKSAMIVSSITFGIGHIVNLFNGSGMDLISNLCQICSAIAIGFLFVVIFFRGGSLIPCIVTHGVLNSLGVFADQSEVTAQSRIMTSAVLALVALGYAMVLWKRLLRQENMK